VLKIRRLYFYLVAYVSLSMLISGLCTVVRVLLEQALSLDSSGILFGAFSGRGQFREQTALSVALTLVGLPVWLLHWRAAQNWAGSDERSSALRRLYLNGVLLTTALTAYSSARDLTAHLLGLLLGLPRGGEVIGGLVRPLPYLVVALLFWLYHWRLAAADRQAYGEVGASATLRRWYPAGTST
jgi:hypothetical protein